MTVEILIGLKLDSGVVTPPENSLGVLKGGQLVLLDWLETQLGLTSPPISFTTRLVQYLACLKSSNDIRRFYSDSLITDEFATARQLLQWRDIWYEAGWTGNSLPNEQSRLKDMSDVETIAMDQVSLGVGQRVQRVIEQLENDMPEVVVKSVDELHEYPYVWQQLLIIINAQYFNTTLNISADKGSDLGCLQQRLLEFNDSDDTQLNKLKLLGDGSVLVLKAPSAYISAPWITGFSRELLQDYDDHSIAILAQERGDILDESLEHQAGARLGYTSSSYWRPVFQILPLAFELMWEPLDPIVLLQFLTHPVGPIPAHVREQLAEIVASEPGINGPTWQTAIERLVSNAGKKNAKNIPEDIEHKLKIWLNCQRFTRDGGIPIKNALERTHQVSQWLNASMNVQEDAAGQALYGAALNQSDELARALERLREQSSQTITPESLRRLIEAVRGTGVSRPDRHAECIATQKQLLHSQTPAAFITPIGAVIWWGCDHEILPRRYPWSPNEIQTLKNSNVHLLSTAIQLDWQANSWLRPILCARKQFILILHDNAESHHPIWDMISTICEGWKEENMLPLIQENKPLSTHLAMPRVTKVETFKLPPLNRWWQLPVNVDIGKRDKESYSSLEKFIYGPYQWVLNYKARIRAGSLQTIADGNLLKGSLVHDLFEEYFLTHTDLATIDIEEAKTWAQSHVYEQLALSGAVMLSPARQDEKELFIETTCNALTVLIEKLQTAGIVKVLMESEQNGIFKGGKIGGSIDMLLINKQEKEAVIDVKWGGLKYRRKSLLESSYLQLGVYAELRRQITGHWPALGYFIINDARLLSLDTDYFPDAESITPENNENPAEFWQRFQHSWQWRRNQLDNHLIEVGVTGTEQDQDNSSPGEKGLIMPETYDSFNDYKHLTGWGENE